MTRLQKVKHGYAPGTEASSSDVRPGPYDASSLAMDGVEADDGLERVLELVGDDPNKIVAAIALMDQLIACRKKPRLRRAKKKSTRRH